MIHNALTWIFQNVLSYQTEGEAKTDMSIVKEENLPLLVLDPAITQAFWSF